MGCAAASPLAANSRQQTHLATFRVRALQTLATSTATPKNKADLLRARPGRVRAFFGLAQLPTFPPSGASTQERASTPPTTAPRAAAEQPAAQPPTGQLQQPNQPPPSRKRPRSMPRSSPDSPEDNIPRWCCDDKLFVRASAVLKSQGRRKPMMMARCGRVCGY